MSELCSTATANLLPLFVPIDDLNFLEEIEDELDNRIAEAALAESDKRIAYEEARRKLKVPSSMLKERTAMGWVSQKPKQRSR